MQTDVSETKADPKDDFYQPDTAVTGIDGFFSLSASKIVSITPGQPFDGWVTLAFSDESDDLGLNSQMFYVPEPLFYKTVKRWLFSKGIEWDEA